MKKNILFIHQSSDLYGSDKTLLSLVLKLNKNRFNPIVVLPQKGLLLEELNKNNITVIITPVVKIHKKMFNLKELLGAPFLLIKSILKLNKELKGIKLHVVQSNTVVVLLGFIYAKLKGIKHFWHIHEVMESPKVAVNFFTFLVSKFSDIAIFNSKTTQESFCKIRPEIRNKSIVIYNGLDRINPFLTKENILSKKNDLNISQDNIVIGLVGRINPNKGHILLVKAFKNLLKKHSNLELIFVGSVVKGKEEVKETINHIIKELQLVDKIKFIPFQKNIWQIWDIIDIAIIPSTKQESFGLVAIEAMLSKKPIVVSNNGALLEIVEDKKSGLLFKTNSVSDLTKKIDFLLMNKDKRDELTLKGNQRASFFTLEKYIEGFEKIYLEV